MIPLPVLLLYIYGALLIVGGAMGYVKAKSVPSLAAGLVCGVIEILMGLRYTWYWAPVVAALLLIFVMGRRYLNTRKAMPALPIVALSIIVAIVQVCILLIVGRGHEPL
jgi:uncharacterized membrane protein (UPF0136 family)